MRSNFLKIRRLRPQRHQTDSPSSHQGGSTLQITNKDQRYRLAFGSEFKDMLQARDQVLEHEFDLEIDFTSLSNDGAFNSSQFYQDLLKNIKEFLLQAISNVVSAAFKLLTKGDLQQKEAKEYASKNMMLNIRAIFLKTVKAIEGNSLITEKLDVNQLKQLRKQLAIDIDYIVNSILVNLADNYPQAPAAGGTIRMRDAIVDIKRVQEQANDLIVAFGIKIQDFIDEQKKENNDSKPDYTKFIMKVINTAINAVNSIEGDYKERSLFEKFNQFCETLFPLIHQEEYRSFIAHYQSKSKNQDQQDLKKTVRDIITNHFSLLLQESKDTAHSLQKDKENNKKDLQMYHNINDNKLSQRSSKDLNAKQSQAHTTQILQLHKKFEKMVKNSEHEVEDLKKSQKYALGQKIPAYVKQFTRQQIQGKQFRADHSSILRVMTKWAENLKQIFDNPEHIIYKRLYPFKTTTNQLVHLDYNYKDGAKKFIQQLQEQGKKVQRQEKFLLQSCYKLMSEIMSEDSKLQGNVRRYSDTRNVASKINAVLTFLMLKYLNLLIQHLIQAGNQIYTDKQQQNINLVVFRVCDLLRSKLQCTETQFISLLKTMYVLDDSEQMKGKFKLVRIKNKLDDPANNIIINYLFMGRVQCELQLSIQEPKGKQKNYYIFSHFVYELTRGRFGTIAECAIMISQLDPMVIASKGTYYTQKKAEPGLLKTSIYPESFEKEQKSKEESLQKETNSFEDVIFHCSLCQRLVVNESRNIFRSDSISLICNKCFSKQKDYEKYLKDDQLRSIFTINQPTKSYLRRADKGYVEVKEEVLNAKDKYLLMLKMNQRGKLAMHLVTYIQDQLRIMVVRIDSDILQNHSKQQGVDFCSLDAIDIAKLIKKQKKRASQDLIYLINDMNKVQQLLKINLQNFQQKIIEFRQAFIDFRLQKTTVKSIKAKSEVFNANQKKQKFEKLDILMQNRQMSKYKKHPDLDFSSIREIQAENVKLTAVPSWLCTLSNLKMLDLRYNSIKQVKEGQLPSSITHLDLGYNQLTKINIATLTNIKQLRLYRNQLTSIDLSHSLLNLNNLNIGCNQLTSINLSHNLPNLTILNLYSNKLSSIDLRQNMPRLKQIYVTFNRLTSIDLNHNLPSLYKLNLFNNKLTQIDLYNYLPDLQQLTLAQNKLISINFGFNVPKLKIINLQDNNNNLISMKVLPMKSLKEFRCDVAVARDTNFSDARHLDKLVIYNGRVQRQELQSLSQIVKVQYE